MLFLVMMVTSLLAQMCSLRRIRILSEETWSGFKEFFIRRILNSLLIETLICLIPKKENANRVKEFWPISLITCVYKVSSC